MIASVVLILLSILLIPHSLSYINVFIANIGNWCGTPEVASWTTLSLHWMAILAMRNYLATKRPTMIQGKSDQELIYRSTAMALTTGRWMLIAGAVVLLEPMAISMIMECGQQAWHRN